MSSRCCEPFSRSSRALSLNLRLTPPLFFSLSQVESLESLGVDDSRTVESLCVAFRFKTRLAADTFPPSHRPSSLMAKMLTAEGRRTVQPSLIYIVSLPFAFSPYRRVANLSSLLALQLLALAINVCSYDGEGGRGFRGRLIALRLREEAEGLLYSASHGSTEFSEDFAKGSPRLLPSTRQDPQLTILLDDPSFFSCLREFKLARCILIRWALSFRLPFSSTVHRSLRAVLASSLRCQKTGDCDLVSSPSSLFASHLLQAPLIYISRLLSFAGTSTASSSVSQSIPSLEFEISSFPCLRRERCLTFPSHLKDTTNLLLLFSTTRVLHFLLETEPLTRFGVCLTLDLR